MRVPAQLFVLCVLGCVAVPAAAAEEYDYFFVEVGPLLEMDSDANIVGNRDLHFSWYHLDTSPRVIVPTGAEAYLLWPQEGDRPLESTRIVGRKPRGKKIDGRFLTLRRLPDQPRESALAQFPFSVDARPAATASKEDFLLAKGGHYQKLWGEQMAGAALFRHLAMESLEEVGQTAKSVGPSWPLPRMGDMQDTIALMSGGRAVSENLQLDRELQPGPDDDGIVMQTLDQVTGITINEFDWSTRLQDDDVALDPLAKAIPHDQYVVFLPSFAALERTVDDLAEVTQPLVQWIEPDSQKTDMLAFYQNQLGLPLDTITRQFGSALVNEIAVTGSDPYFRTGTDLAVVMQAKQGLLLHQAVLAQIGRQAERCECKREEHKSGKHTVAIWKTDDRRFSSYVARVGDLVIAANSMVQMQKVLECLDGIRPDIAGLDEYRFFRQRYRRSPRETALIVITDAAIRRWCGPQWRISASRRTRARATIAEATMRHLDELVRETIESTQPLPADSSLPFAGELLLTPRAVLSKQYGTLEFQTPIAEMNISKASEKEIALYTAWRDLYQQRWRNMFDPIAVQLTIADDSMSVGLTVMPLILGSQYRDFIELAGAVHLKPVAGDPHPEALIHYTMALDPQSEPFRDAREVIPIPGADPLGWIDGAISFYFDEDQNWTERLAATEDAERTEMLHELPVGLYVPSKDNFRLGSLLVTLRQMIDGAAPNMFRWEQIAYKELKYVKISAQQGTPLGPEETMPNVYYVPTPDGLTATFNEQVVRRAIDRYLSRQAEKSESSEVEEDASSNELLPQLKFIAQGTAARLLADLQQRDGPPQRMTRLAWSNIPVLNWLRNHFPDRDPFKTYEKVFRQQPIEPAGGEYVWNETLQTYQSTLYGDHLDPRFGPAIPPGVHELNRLETELGFQNNGVQARLRLSREDREDEAGSGSK